MAINARKENSVHTSPGDGSVTRWLHMLKAGEGGLAEQEIWNRYFGRLVAIARTKLRDSPKRIGDEEDAVLEAMNSFFMRVKKGQFPDLTDRTDLWVLLVTITLRKVANQKRWERAKMRRSPGQLVGEDLDVEQHQIEDIVDGSPTPEIAAMTAEEASRLLDLLPREELRRTALLRLQGHTNLEIAAKENVIKRTIERRLETIRAVWLSQMDESDES